MSILDTNRELARCPYRTHTKDTVARLVSHARAEGVSRVGEARRGNGERQTHLA